ncbi:g11137 [Coccomyxa viridis]|uniref:G11137 protein n=1 Tax=Coccomyxa viridis TaxID=1274662 RepID=A0ABP1GBX7_9CHLO
MRMCSQGLPCSLSGPTNRTCALRSCGCSASSIVALCMPFFGRWISSAWAATPDVDKQGARRRPAAPRQTWKRSLWVAGMCYRAGEGVEAIYQMHAQRYSPPAWTQMVGSGAAKPRVETQQAPAAAERRPTQHGGSMPVSYLL